MKKNIILFITLLLLSCSDSEVYVQYHLKNVTDRSIIVEHKESDSKKTIYTIAPNTQMLVYSATILNEFNENENDKFNKMLSEIYVSTSIDNITYNIEKDSISLFSKWDRYVSYDMDIEYISYVLEINSDMLKKTNTD